MQVFTLTSYRVIPGKEDVFVRRWEEMGKILASLPNPPREGTLIRSTGDGALFHAFSPWASETDVRAMRSNPRVLAAFQAISVLCLKMTPGNYEVIRNIPVNGAAAGRIASR